MLSDNPLARLLAAVLFAATLLAAVLAADLSVSREDYEREILANRPELAAKQAIFKQWTSPEGTRYLVPETKEPQQSSRGYQLSLADLQVDHGVVPVLEQDLGPLGFPEQWSAGAEDESSPLVLNVRDIGSLETRDTVGAGQTRTGTGTASFVFLSVEDEDGDGDGDGYGDENEGEGEGEDKSESLTTSLASTSGSPLQLADTTLIFAQPDSTLSTATTTTTKATTKASHEQYINSTSSVSGNTSHVYNLTNGTIQSNGGEPAGQLDACLAAAVFFVSAMALL